MNIYSMPNEYEDKLCEEHPDSLKSCEWCGEKFYPRGRNASRSKKCLREHHTKCEWCGSDIKINEYGSYKDYLPHTCSRICANNLKHKKSNETIKSKYGVDNPSQYSEFKERAKESNKLKAKQTAERRKATMIERYGSSTPMGNKYLREKIESTNLERYGHKNPSKNEDVRYKISEKLKSKEVKSKYKFTSLSHFGVEYPAQSEEVQSKMRETCLKHHGVEYPSSLESVRDKAKTTNLKKYGVEHTFQREDVKAKSLEARINSTKYGRTSNINKMFKKHVLDNYHIELIEEFPLGGKFYDFKVPDKNILIEVDPTYTHNSFHSHYHPNGLPTSYHKIKSEIASKNGYRCIHIFDWDDIDKVLNSFLMCEEVIGARKLTLHDNTKCLLSEYDTFLNSYHFKRTCKGQDTVLGLYLDDTLVQVMTFGKSRYSKKYQWELLRLCTHPKFRVIGGANKLFTHFIKTKKPQSVVSYCDYAKFSGDVYLNIGMEYHHTTSPSKIWSKDDKYVSETLLKSQGYDRLFNTNYGKGISNEDLMIRNGWVPVYDCGVGCYIYSSV